MTRESLMEILASSLDREGLAPGFLRWKTCGLTQREREALAAVADEILRAFEKEKEAV